MIALGAEGGSASAAGLTLTVDQGALRGPIKVKVERKDNPPGELAALPQALAPAGPFFLLELEGELSSPLEASLPLFSGQDAETLDLFGLQGDTWGWLSGALLTGDRTSATGSLPFIPRALAIVRMDQSTPSIGGIFAAGAAMEAPTAQALDTLSPLYTLAADGTPQEAGAIPQTQGKQLLPLVQNKQGEEYSGELLDRLLANPEQRTKHQTALLSLVQTKKAQGLILDYQGLSSLRRAEFSRFVEELAGRLHAEELRLGLRLALPKQAGNMWDTSAYDWRRLGAAADTIQIAPAQDPARYYSIMPEVLHFATMEVDRRKLRLLIHPHSYEQSPGGLRPLSLSEALALAGQVEVKDQDPLAPGKTVTLIAPNLLADGGATGLRWSDEANTLTFSFPGPGGSRTVWLENPFSVAFKLELASRFNLGGVAVQTGSDPAAEAPLWRVIQSYKERRAVDLVKPNETVMGIRWETEDGELLAAGRSWANWPIPSRPGEHTVYTYVNDGTTDYRAGSRSYRVVPTPTPVPAPVVRPAPTPAPAPAPPPPPLVAPPPSGVRYPGVGFGMQIDPNNDMNRSLSLLRGAGFNWAKIQLRWEFLESAKGNIGWGDIDRWVNGVNAQGVRLLFSVVTAPRWSRPGDTDFNVPGPPANPQDFADFLGAIAARHKGKVHAYEVWNEQNLWYEWGGVGRQNAAQYVELLKRAYAAIKAADPEAVVLSGAPTPAGNVVIDGKLYAVDDVEYLRQMYAAGLKNYADAIAAHPSGFNNNPDDGPGQFSCCGSQFKGHWSFYYRRFEQFRQVMAEFGDANKQIWFTEFGWASLGDPYPEYGYARDISEDTQARNLVRAFEIAKEKGYIGGMFVWNLNYAPIAEPNDRYGKRAFSILRPDWTPRPAYNSLAAMPK